MTWRPLIPGLLLAVLLSGCGDSNPADRSEGARPGPSQSLPTRLLASTTQTSTPIPATTGQPPGRVVAVGPDQTKEVRVLVTDYSDTPPAASTSVLFSLIDVNSGEVAHVRDHFFGPERK